MDHPFALALRPAPAILAAEVRSRAIPPSLSAAKARRGACSTYVDTETSVSGLQEHLQ
jgi:hypothetical protein